MREPVPVAVFLFSCRSFTDEELKNTFRRPVREFKRIDGKVKDFEKANDMVASAVKKVGADVVAHMTNYTDKLQKKLHKQVQASGETSSDFESSDALPTKKSRKSSPRSRKRKQTPSKRKQTQAGRDKARSSTFKKKKKLKLQAKQKTMSSSDEL